MVGMTHLAEVRPDSEQGTISFLELDTQIQSQVTTFSWQHMQLKNAQQPTFGRKPLKRK